MSDRHGSHHAPDHHAWVPAGPFRAQLRHLLDASGLPLHHLASLLDLPLPICARLLVEPLGVAPGGRPGARTAPGRPRPLVRISPITARRLLLHDAASLRNELTRASDAGPSCDTVVNLLADGHRLTTLHRITGLRLETLADFAERRVGSCPGWVAAAVRSAAIWAETHPAEHSRRTSRRAALGQVRAELAMAGSGLDRAA